MARWRWHFLSLAIIGCLFVACSSTTGTTVTPTPQIIPRGQWLRPQFPNVTTPTVSAFAFAAADARVGYACSATIAPTDDATPAPSPTGTEVTPTPTLTIGGRPTPPTSQNITNALWRTDNGGQSWAPLTIPEDAHSFICPVSALVAPDGADPDDVFLLTAHGNVSLTQPASLLPGQLQFRLWRSRNGGQSWIELTVPTTPNPLVTTILSPYHLIVQMVEDRLIFATNYGGANLLFTSDDEGQTWQNHTASELATDTNTASRAFAGFTNNADGSLYALATVPAAPTATGNLELWQSQDGAKSWNLAGKPTFAGTGTQAVLSQLFAAPSGNTLYLIAQLANGNAAHQMDTMRSTDGGAHWTDLAWPVASQSKPFGGATIALEGVNAAIDARGTAYIAVTNSDAPLAQDPTGQLSAGYFAAPVTQSSWTKIAAPLDTTNSPLGLAVSLTPPDALTIQATPGTGTPVATGTVAATSTPAPTATPTDTATPRPSQTVTPTGGTPGGTVTPSATPYTTGLPTLWTNFGPLALFTTNPALAGSFEQVLP